MFKSSSCQRYPKDVSSFNLVKKDILGHIEFVVISSKWQQPRRGFFLAKGKTKGIR